jgi:hypothetical protein
MKTPMFLLGILLSITAMLCAQSPLDPVQPPETQLFELPYFSIGAAWHFDLGKGNFFELELADNSQLSRFLNVDSLLLVFLDDMKPFRDSLANPMSGKRIDYLIDTAGRKLVRIHETKQRGSAFLLGDDQPSLLRTRQDTIYIFLLAPPLSRNGYLPVRYNRLTVVINRYDQLEGLVATGLNNKIREVDPAAGHRYKGDFNGAGYLAIDPTVTIKKEGLYSSGHDRDFVESYFLFGVQNYRNLFSPTTGFGLNLVFHHRFDIHTVSLYYGGLITFGTDTLSHQRTYISDYFSIGYSYDRLDPNTLKPLGMFTNFSFGWFIQNPGSFVPKNSYIFTLCGLKLMNDRFILEPGSIITGKEYAPYIRLSYRFL